MSNPFFEKETYPFMHKDQVIGKFIIDLNSNGDYVYWIDMNKDTPSNLVPWDFTDEDNNFVSRDRSIKWHTNLVGLWVQSRVFPPERDNAEELLDEIGITEYDQLEILKYTYGKDHLDPYWIDFDKECR